MSSLSLLLRNLTTNLATMLSLSMDLRNLLTTMPSWSFLLKNLTIFLATILSLSMILKNLTTYLATILSLSMSLSDLSWLWSTFKPEQIYLGAKQPLGSIFFRPSGYMLIAQYDKLPTERLAPLKAILLRTELLIAYCRLAVVSIGAKRPLLITLPVRSLDAFASRSTFPGRILIPCNASIFQ